MYSTDELLINHVFDDKAIRTTFKTWD